tara:strand:+ start:203 stop:607 length:405 start_codon:yes stop_codon:yes gene_type:complete
MTYELNKPQKDWVTYTLDGVKYEFAPYSSHKPNGIVETVPFTEKQALEQATKEKNAETLEEAKLKFIRMLRDKKLEETDYMANSDYVMEEKYKTWRQSLRDLPQDNTTEAEYDILLAKDDNEKLTHSIWKQPTS